MVGDASVLTVLASNGLILSVRHLPSGPQGRCSGRLSGISPGSRLSVLTPHILIYRASLETCVNRSTSRRPSAWASGSLANDSMEDWTGIPLHRMSQR